MSGVQNQKNEQNQQQNNQQNRQQQGNALTEQDKKVYAQILGSINRMDKKLKDAKKKATSNTNQAPDLKRTAVNQIAEKLISAKQNSDIVTKQDLVTDIQQTFEEVVVNVYTENRQMKNKINSLIAIIKDQNKKMNEQRQREEKLKQQNQKLREQLVKLQDGRLINQHQAGNKKGVQNVSNISKNIKANNRANTNQNQDYDFWSMPNNESNVKKRKDFVADSGLWINDKDIDKSVFITDQRTKK